MDDGEEPIEDDSERNAHMARATKLSFLSLAAALALAAAAFFLPL